MATAALLLALAAGRHAEALPIELERHGHAASTVDDDTAPAVTQVAGAAVGEQAGVPREDAAPALDQAIPGDVHHPHKIFDMLQRHVMSYSPEVDMVDVDEPSAALDKGTTTTPATALQPEAAKRAEEVRSPHLQIMAAKRAEEVRSPHLQIMPDFEYGLKSIDIDALKRAAHRISLLHPEAKQDAARRRAVDDEFATSRQAAGDGLEGDAAPMPEPAAETPRARATDLERPVVAEEAEEPLPRRLARPKLRRRTIEEYDYSDNME